MTEPLPLQPIADVNAELVAVFATMSGLLLTRESLDDALVLVTSLAVDSVPGAVGAGVSLLAGPGRRTSAAATDARVEQADALQYELDQGPCLEAWAQQTVMRVEDTLADTRWPRWSRRAAQLGLRSALSAPMHSRGVPLGAIKVYGEEPRVFDARAEGLLVRFAEQAAVLVSNVQAYRNAQQLSEGLKEALEARDTIATAKGILMARDGLQPDAAFQLLVRASQRSNTKLRDVAKEIVAANVRRRT